MRAGIYTRISSDDGTALGVRRQENDCRKLAGRLGWDVAGVFSDNDVSASTTKPRPAYSRLLQELRSGSLDALVCWDVDRLTRKPVELEEIIDLAERRGVALASVGGDIDLGTPQGRLTARIKASVARHEVEQSSRRIKRKVLERAETGRPHGRAAYGWRRVDGRDVLVAHEAAVVREMASRLLAGESLRSIASDLDRRGLPTPNGAGRWHPATIRQVVTRERNAGLRRHQRRVIGRGDWEPIFDEDRLQAVCSLLSEPGRRYAPTSASRHLLSGLARCGVCDGRLRVLAAHGSRPSAYVCQGCFGVRRKQVDVDSLIEGLVIARLSRQDAIAAFLPVQDQSALRELATLRARLDSAADQYAEGAIDGPQLARITGRLRPRLHDLEGRVRTTLTPDLSDLATFDIAKRWDEIPLNRKRAVIALLMTIRILPIGKTGRAQFDPAGVEVVWNSAAGPPRNGE